MTWMLPSVYVLIYPCTFREYADVFHCVVCGLLNFANAIVIVLKIATIFKLIDNFDEAVTKSKFWFYYKRIEIK